MHQEFQVERQIEVDAAHRIPTHGSKCRNLHGHRYVISAICRGPLLDDGVQQGMVIDFGFLKKAMRESIHAACDHALILWVNDPLVTHLFDSDEKVLAEIRSALTSKDGVFLQNKVAGSMYIISDVPTAEVLAKHWFDLLKPKVAEISGNKAYLYQLRVHETPQSVAIYPAGHQLRYQGKPD